jgi:glucan phosphorylase
MKGMRPFAVLERARSFMQETAQPFEVALAATRAGNLFTTHTAVAAGFDRFTPALIEQYLGRYAEQKLGIKSMICWPWAARTQTTRRRVSTWPIWQSAAAGR